MEGPIWKCGWWIWNSGQYVIWGQQIHLWSLCVKSIHVQYIMSIWKWLEPANRSIHAFFFSPLINLLPLPVSASVSKRDWFLVLIRLFILPICVYMQWESAPPPCTPGHLLWSACMSISSLLPRQPGNFAISGMLSLFGCKWSMSPLSSFSLDLKPVIDGGCLTCPCCWRNCTALSLDARLGLRYMFQHYLHISYSHWWTGWVVLFILHFDV